jgi:hypothetical protein
MAQPNFKLFSENKTNLAYLDLSYKRDISDRLLGYYQTLREGQNRISDPNLAAYYAHLSLIIRGPLFDPERLAAIWKMNTGQYDYLVDTGFYRTYAGQVPLSELNNPIADDDCVNAHCVGDLSHGGIQVVLPGLQAATNIDLSYYPDNELLQVDYYRGEEVVGTQSIPPLADSVEAKKGQLAAKRISVPQRVVKQGYDKIGISFPQMNWAVQYRLGYFRLIAADNP